MLKEHRPYYLKRWHMRAQRWYVNRWIRPQLTDLGRDTSVLKPWHLVLYGGPIQIGDFAHIICTQEGKVRLSVIGPGRIQIGNHALICPGVRMSSASAIEVGDNCMFANNAYITDADWHDLYDRTQHIGGNAPVVLEDNVWIGDSAIVCKGVRVGENSIVGAGSVVTRDVPPNSIAAGNPARVVKELDPEQAVVTRARLFRDPEALEHELERIDRYLLKDNSLWGWLRSKWAPRPGD